MRKLVEYVADFETNTTEQTVKLYPVWAWGAAKVGNSDTFTHGTNISSFFNYLKDHPGRYWFHNLAFDGKFIIDYCFRLGFQWTDRTPQPREFSTCIGEMGQFYSIEINLEGKSIIFADSYKKVTMSLRAAAKTYDLNMSKGEIDYSEYRAPDHELTDVELDYLRRDVLILSQVMAERLKHGDKLTSSSDAIHVYKDLTSTRKFRRYFPLLPKRADTDIRQSYRGGYVYVNPIHQNKVHTAPGVSLDVNSMYPYVMRYREYPFGVPEFVTNKADIHGLYIINITFTAHLKPHALPCIQVKGDMNYNPREYQRDINQPLTQWFTSVDLELIEQMYDLDIWEFGGAYCFNSQMGLFDDYIDINNYNKVNAHNAGERFQAKLMNNSLYGKFGQKISGVQKKPVFENDKVRYVNTDMGEREPMYIPIAAFVTAYARKHLITTAAKFGENYIYSDTDSIKAFGDVPKWLDTDPKKLGYFDDEYHFDKSIFIRPKTYAVHIKDGYIYKCAGMPQGLKKVMKFEDFRIGFTNDERLITKNNLTIDSRYMSADCMKLLPKTVPGGVVLVETPFTIRDNY